MFRDRGIETVRKVPKVQMHHLPNKYLLEVISDSPMEKIKISDSQVLWRNGKPT